MQLQHGKLSISHICLLPETHNLYKTGNPWPRIFTNEARKKTSRRFVSIRGKLICSYINTTLHKK